VGRRTAVVDRSAPIVTPWRSSAAEAAGLLPIHELGKLAMKPAKDSAYGPYYRREHQILKSTQGQRITNMK
jgi:hypothetical protein